MKQGPRLFLLALIGVAIMLMVLSQRSKTARPAPTEDLIVIENHDVPEPAVKKNTIQTIPTHASAPSGPAPTLSVNTPKFAEPTPVMPQRPPLTAREIESVNKITKAISKAIAKKLNSNQFMKMIQALQLKPHFLDEGSSVAGTMVTVRTHNALEGTRYLHAQFVGEKNKANIIEHVSFQIRAGSDSFQKAVEILNQVLPDDKVVKESSSDYVRYNTKDGYVAWIKIGDRDDLKSNKYNASSKEDVGTVIVAIEMEIHDSDEHGH